MLLYGICHKKLFSAIKEIITELLTLEKQKILL